MNTSLEKVISRISKAISTTLKPVNIKKINRTLLNGGWWEVVFYLSNDKEASGKSESMVRAMPKYVKVRQAITAIEKEAKVSVFMAGDDPYIQVQLPKMYAKESALSFERIIETYFSN